MSRNDERPRGAPKPRSGEQARELSGRFGDFELVELVGRDGPFAYYRAHQISLDRTVILKVLVEGSQSIERAGLLRREAETVNRLDHPDIIRVFEVGIHQGIPFLVMAGIDGEPLSERLKFGPLPPRLAAELARQLTDSLSYAHDKGVIHSALRPGAIWLSGQQARLCGFGQLIQYDTADLGALTSFAGYLAPEQAGARGVIGKNTDVYGLGAILFAMLTGKPPHRAATVKETFAVIRQRRPVEPSRLVRTVGEDLDAICATALDPSPAARYGVERPLPRLHADLGRYLAGKPVKREERDPGRVIVSYLRRHYRALVAAVLVVLGVALPALFDRYRRRSAWEVIARPDAAVAEYLHAEHYFESRSLDHSADPETAAGLALARLRRGQLQEAALSIPSFYLDSREADGARTHEIIWNGAHDDWTTTTKLVRVLIALQQGRWTQANAALTGRSKVMPQRPVDWRLFDECNRRLRADDQLVAAVWAGDVDAARYAAESPPSSLMLQMLIEKLSPRPDGHARVAAAWLLARFGRLAAPALPALIAQLADSSAVELRAHADDPFASWLGGRPRILFRTAAIKALDAIDPEWPRSLPAKAAVSNLIDALAVQANRPEGVKGAAELVAVLERIDPDWMSSKAAEAHRRDWQSWPRQSELPDLGRQILQRLDARKKPG